MTEKVGDVADSIADSYKTTDNTIVKGFRSKFAFIKSLQRKLKVLLTQDLTIKESKKRWLFKRQMKVS